jgi:diketogulonate reductase-like aldo/keto reductase
MLTKVFKLNEFEIPMVGLGTRNLIGQRCRKLIASAVHMGYKLIDTNPVFKNDHMIAEAVKNSKREDIFICTKVPASALDYNSAFASVEKTLENFKFDYLDLVLIESPGKAEIPGHRRCHAKYRAETWRALIGMKQQGLIKNIGVANFLPRHIDEIWDKYAMNPVANMIELNPFCYEPEVIEYHNEKKIQIIAASPLARRNKEIWNLPILQELRLKYKVSKAQVLLKWAIQKGAVVIPKAKDFQNSKLNCSLDFEISPEDMTTLDGLARNMRLGWNSATIK